MAEEGSVQMLGALSLICLTKSIYHNAEPARRRSSSVTTNFTAWSQQLEVRCVAHNVWDIVNPETTSLPGEKPTEIRAPAFSDFHGANNIEDPTNSAELSPAGLKALKEELNIFKILFDQYKNDLRK
ncbi:hypothetical protein P3342_004805 [Pyrenophora teres f. teres]|nr:hypothetical protein P3342_004805 [Pyrenophora teres f. teres]